MFICYIFVVIINVFMKYIIFVVFYWGPYILLVLCEDADDAFHFKLLLYPYICVRVSMWMSIRPFF